MMKKLVVGLLSAMMVLSLVACGGDDTAVDDTNQQVEENVDAGDEVADDVEDVVVNDEISISPDAMYLALGVDSIETVMMAEMLDLTGTAWSLSGGLVDGVEMSQDDYVSVLEQNYSGMMEFVFDADGVAYMVYAGHTENPVIVTGAYEYGENHTVVMEFDINGQMYSYTGILAPVDDGAGNEVAVLLVLTDTSDLTNALYFILE